MLSNSHLTQTDHHLTAAAVIMTRLTHSRNTRRVHLSSHWPGLNALGGTACNWPSYRSVSGYAKLAPAYRKYCRLRIVSEGVLTYLPPHPEENYHLHPNENFRIENPQLHCTTTKRGLDTYEYTYNTINIQTGSRYKQIEYMDNTINIQTNTINLQLDRSNGYYMT